VITSRKTTVAVLAAAVTLAVLSVLALAETGGAFGRGSPWRSGSSCAVPALPGAVIDATLINMGGPMMRGSGGSMGGGMMRVSLDKNTVTAGQLSFVAINGGSVSHELVILPLPDGQIVGTRTIGPDSKIEENGSLGEASATCAAGGGDGIAPRSLGWVTVMLPAGRYEIVCNLPGHYAAGMYAQLIVA
jgi:uncharacterized cupredoxin-like copper-binding protein